jgi:hypothetical protein
MASCKILFTIACTHTHTHAHRCDLKKHRKEEEKRGEKPKRVQCTKIFSLDDFVYIQGISSCYKEKGMIL